MNVTIVGAVRREHDPLSVRRPEWIAVRLCIECQPRFRAARNIDQPHVALASIGIKQPGRRASPVRSKSDCRIVVRLCYGLELFSRAIEPNQLRLRTTSLVSKHAIL